MSSHRSPSLSFSHLNLRWNPFGEAEMHERAELAVLALPRLRTGELLQIIGAEGRGKSTHLHAFARRHADAVYEYIPEGQRRFLTPVGSTPLLLLDEAQRLTHRQRRRLFRGFTTLALGTHEDLTASCPRAINTLRVEGIDVQRLDQIVRRRVEWARRGPGPVPTLPRAALMRLIDRFEDNLRALEDHLYEVFQTLEGPGDVEV